MLSNFESDAHALYTGWVIGRMIKEEMPVVPRVDEQGDYKPEVDLDIGGYIVTLVIPSPPDEWDMT